MLHARLAIAFTIALVLLLARRRLRACWIFWTATPLGNGYGAPPRRFRISPAEAVRLAGPYLEESYRLRRQRRGAKESPEATAVAWVSCSGSWYFVSRDHRPSYTPGFYLHFSVRVHGLTGQVLPPDPDRSL